MLKTIKNWCTKNYYDLFIFVCVVSGFYLCYKNNYQSGLILLLVGMSMGHVKEEKRLEQRITQLENNANKW